MDSHGYYSTFEDRDDRDEDDTADQSSGDAGKFEKQSKHLIEIIDGRGGFDRLEDGFWYYFTGQESGALAAWGLRVIAEELDRRNKSHEEEIEEYFKTLSKEKEDERES